MHLTIRNNIKMKLILFLEMIVVMINKIIYKKKYELPEISFIHYIIIFFIYIHIYIITTYHYFFPSIDYDY